MAEGFEPASSAFDKDPVLGPRDQRHIAHDLKSRRRRPAGTSDDTIKTRAGTRRIITSSVIMMGVMNRQTAAGPPPWSIAWRAPCRKFAAHWPHAIVTPAGASAASGVSDLRRLDDRRRVAARPG